MTIEFVQILQDMLGDLQGTPEPVEVKLFGDDFATLETLASRIGEKLKKIDGLVDLVEPRRGNPELEVRIDPTRAAKAGFTTQEVSTQLANGLLGDVATEVRRADRLIDLRVRYPDAYRFNSSWIRRVPARHAGRRGGAAVSDRRHRAGGGHVAAVPRRPEADGADHRTARRPRHGQRRRRREDGAGVAERLPVGYT